MTISKFLNDKFNLDVICDEEGVYSYIIHTSDDKVKLDKVSSNITFSNSILLECDDDNFISLKYFDDEEYQIFSLDGTKISEIEYLDDEYEDVNGDVNIEKSLIFYSKTWDRRYLRIDLQEKLRLSFEVDYDKYDTNENGVIIWE